MHKAIKAAEAGAAKGMTVTAKTKTKVKVSPMKGRSLRGGKRQMAGGYMPVDTPPGTAPMPLGQPVPASPKAPTVRPPRVPRAPTPSGKGRVRKPSMGKRQAMPPFKPYASDAQRRFFHTDTAKAKGITAEDVHGKDQVSKGRSLPKKVGGSRSARRSRQMAKASGKKGLVGTPFKKPIAGKTISKGGRQVPGTLPGSGPMDTPPPSPSIPGGGVGGQMPTLSGLAQPAPIGSANLPPEILTGILAAAQKIDGIFDSFAQVTPDLAADLDLCKQVLQKYLGKVMSSGGGATSPNAPGSNFPGGGINQGQPGPGSTS